METVLFTGGSGYLGSAVMERLGKTGEYNIIAVSSKPPKNVNGGGQWKLVNLLNKDEVTALMNQVRPDILCHFAWSASGKGYRQSEDNLDWIEASFHLMRQFHGRRLIYAGSSSEYELVDDSGKRSWSLYGTSKLMFETLAMEYCRENNISFASGRIFTVYGPGDIKVDAAIPSAIQTMLRGKPFRCNAPNNMWDYIFIDDAAEALTRLICSDVEGILDIGTGKPIFMRQAFQTIADIVGYPDCLMCNEDNTDSVRLVANVTHMKQKLDYTAEISFSEGIAKTVTWWKEQDTL